MTRPKRKNKSSLIPLEEGKDLATVGSSYLSKKHQVTGDQGRRVKDDEEDSDILLRPEVQKDKATEQKEPSEKSTDH